MFSISKNYLTTIYVLFFSSLAFNFFVPLAAQIKDTTPVIFHHEGEDHLQKHQESSLETVLSEFLGKGGRVFRLEGDSEPFQFLPGDVVFPSCSAGFNRSQTVWALLQPYAKTIKLMPPHATRYGFDPYDDTLDGYFNNIEPSDIDEFKLWSGFDKQTKFGWDNFVHSISEDGVSQDELELMREYYNREYYCPPISSETRRVYITFAKNAHVHLYRLCQTNDTLANAIVLFFPLEDLIHKPEPAWQTIPQSEKAYREYAKKLRKFFDFSPLSS